MMLLSNTLVSSAKEEIWLLAISNSEVVVEYHLEHYANGLA